MTDRALEKTSGAQRAALSPPEAPEPEQPAQTAGQKAPRGRPWTSSIPQIVGEDNIAIGGGRRAHFRRDRRFAQVQVVFTAPEGVDPDPGRELTDQFEEQGWTWEPHKAGKPWTYQLERPSEDDPTARGDSHDVLHEQFVIIINEYREQQGLPPTSGWKNLFPKETKPTATRQESFNSSAADDPAKTGEEQKPKPTNQETRAGRGRGAADQTAAMLDAFASVGAARFDLTFTDAAGEKVGFRGNRPLDQLRSAMPDILRAAEEQRHNVIVRPRSAGTTLIQLDDLNEQTAARLRPVSFLTLRTSPGSYQAWVAVADADADFARQLRKSTGADLTASGAARVSGSRNFKAKHAPAFPRVETVHASPGMTVTRAEVEALGVVAPQEKITPAVIHPHHSGPRGWPSYQQCLEHPRAQKEGRPDRSKADFTFCLLAIDWGWGIEETTDRLMQESGKAQAEGVKYALRTARAAARVVEGRENQRAFR